MLLDFLGKERLGPTRPKWEQPTRYDGAKLRAIRKRKGVGRPPIEGEWDNYSRGVQADHVNNMADKKWHMEYYSHRSINRAGRKKLRDL